MLEEQYTEEELAQLENQAKSENFPVWYYTLLGHFCQKSTDALVGSTSWNELPYVLLQQGFDEELELTCDCHVAELSLRSLFCDNNIAVLESTFLWITFFTYNC